MDWMNLLQQIFEVCIIPLLGILTTYFIVFIKNKSNELKEVTDNELYRKYIDLALSNSPYIVEESDKIKLMQVFNRGGFSARLFKWIFR